MIALLGKSTRVVVSDFAHGGRIISATPRLRPLGQDDILARALWLERRGREEEAVEYLDRECARMH